MTPATNRKAGQDLFLIFRLIGDNFTDHSIPLSVVEQLAELEDAIRSLAAREYMADHPNTGSAPHWVFGGIGIKLASMGTGNSSSDPGFSLAFTCVDPPEAGKSRRRKPSQGFGYYEQARDNIINRLQRAAEGLPPAEAVTEPEAKFYQGLTALLAEGGQLEITTSGQASSVALLTQEACQQLPLEPGAYGAAEQVSIRGTVPQADLAKNTFTICRLDGYEFTAKIPPAYRKIVLQLLKGYADEDKAKAKFSGTGPLNPNGKLMWLDTIDAIEVLDPLDVAARLEELRYRPPLAILSPFGGKVPSEEGLQWLEQKLKDHYGNELPLPHIRSTTGNGAILQWWRIGNSAASLDIALDTHKGYWGYVGYETQESGDRTLNLDDPKDWEWVTEQIHALHNAPSKAGQGD